GPAASAVAFQDQDNNIPNGATVTVNGDGKYTLFGTEAVGPLVINDGTVGASGLVSVATLTMTGGSITTSSVGGIQLNGDAAATSSASTGSAVITGGFVQMGAATRTFTVADGPAGVDLDISAEI